VAQGASRATATASIARPTKSLIDIKAATQFFRDE
jgi:hypothetical protein